MRRSPQAGCVREADRLSLGRLCGPLSQRPARPGGRKNHAPTCSSSMHSLDQAGHTASPQVVCRGLLGLLAICVCLSVIHLGCRDYLVSRAREDYTIVSVRRAELLPGLGWTVACGQCWLLAHLPPPAGGVTKSVELPSLPSVF